MEMVQSEKFYAGLSAADGDCAEAIEAELVSIIPGGLPEDTTLKFVQTLIEIRRELPETTLEGLLWAAIVQGCAVVKMMTAKKPTRKSKLSGRGI